jgi:putative aminopeptidase FrvX
MHTPVETVDIEDLVATAELAGAFAARTEAFAPFGIEV